MPTPEDLKAQCHAARCSGQISKGTADRSCSAEASRGFEGGLEHVESEDQDLVLRVFGVAGLDLGLRGDRDRVYSLRTVVRASFPDRDPEARCF